MVWPPVNGSSCQCDIAVAGNTLICFEPGKRISTTSTSSQTSRPASAVLAVFGIAMNLNNTTRLSSGFWFG